AIFSLTEVPGMEFICTGYSRSYNGFAAYDIVLFKVDTAGQMKWLKNITSPGVDIGYEITPSVNGGYLMTGLFDNNTSGDYLLIHSDTIPNTTVGINSAAEENEINFYPNPGDEVLYVHSTLKEGVIDIVNLLGEKIKTQTLFEGTNSINIKSIPNGLYKLIIRSGA